MPLPNNALVLVTDGRKLLLLRNHGDQNQIDLRVERHDERADAKNGEMTTDAPGTNKQSAGYGHTAYEQTDFHQLQENRWAKQAAEQVNRRALRNDFNALAIVAPPKSLGELRKCLHKETIARVMVEIDKEMTGRPIADIEALLVAHTAPAELADV
ncbi:MAG: hypothetical protein NVS3B5_14040 [Sphingomicrobium sp.]